MVSQKNLKRYLTGGPTIAMLDICMTELWSIYERHSRIPTSLRNYSQEKIMTNNAQLCRGNDLHKTGWHLSIVAECGAQWCYHRWIKTSKEREIPHGLTHLQKMKQASARTGERNSSNWRLTNIEEEGGCEGHRGSKDSVKKNKF
jgi:hypothetical protein